MWGKQPAAMLAIYTGRGVIPEVNLRECISHMLPQSLDKAAHYGFETQSVAISVRIDRFSRIELFPSNVLSSEKD